MIVRCTNCVSAFAVDDSKVANRKFAFTCPKCGTENIFDNRKQEEKPASDDLFFDEGGEEQEFRETAVKESSFEHDLGSEDAFFEEPATSPEKKSANGINLEIEETTSSEEEISFDDDFLIDEKPVKKAAPVEEEISFDEDIFLEEEKPVKKTAPVEEEISFDEDIFLEEETPAKKPAPVEEEILFEEDELLVDEKPVKKPAPAEEEISFDEDIFLEEETPSKKPAPVEEEILFEEDELLAEEKPVKKAAPADEEISFDEDIFLEEEKPAKKAVSAEDEILFDDEFIIDETETPEESKKDRNIDEDLLDIGLELEVESPGKTPGDRDVKVSSQDDIDAMFAELPAEEDLLVSKKTGKEKTVDDDITVNLDELDIELEGDIPLSEDEFISFDDTAKPAPKGKEDEPLFDDDITIDMESLDIDIEEAGDIHKPDKTGEIPSADEEELFLNIDEFEDEFAEDKKGAPAHAEAAAKRPAPPEDDITLDLDSLDIDLDESEINLPAEKTVKSKSAAEAMDESAEEDLILSVDEMDVDIEELEEKPSRKAAIEEAEEDESITIDLETLDIEVAETPEIMSGEMTEEDEKLTLDDAGLTFSELTEEEIKREHSEAEEEELFLSLDEVDPDLKLQVIGEEAPADEKLLSETVDDLPEIDLEEYEAVIREEEFKSAKDNDIIIEGLDEFENIELSEISETAVRPVDLDILEYEETGEENYTPAKGSTTFSIDYSLKYSRLGAFLRLIGLYMFSMIPHFIVMLIYTILSGILGFINQIVILSTGRCVEDFSQITENTLRYFLYIKTNITGIVEDRPVYAGRESLSHQMQLNITYPVKYSRNLAILRLTIIGIWFITIPHFIIMSLLTLLVPFVYLAGIITVIITRRWPNPLFIFLTRYFRYLARISSFLLGLTDEYPPFRFD